MDTKPSPGSNDGMAVEVEPDTRAGRSATSCKAILAENAVLLLTLVGVVLGFAIGFGVRELEPSQDALMWIGMPGELFLRMLNLMIVPLITGSVISGTAALDPQSNGKMSLAAFIWIVSTNTLSCLLGVLLSVTIRPGSGSGGSDDAEPDSPFETQDIFADLLRNLIPSNIVEVGFRKAVTQYQEEEQQLARNLTNGTIVMETVLVRTGKSNGKSDSVNVLGLIFVCLIIGIAANRLGKSADLFIRFFTILTEIVLKIMRWFFWTSPIGVASLIAKAIAGIDDLSDSFSKLGMFVVVVVVGVLLFQLVVLSLLLLVVTRRNPVYFHYSILRPYFIGFASTSTAVAIPEMLYCVEVKNKIDSRVARFAVPFSVTLSANGSAVFIVSSAIFIAQFIGRELSTGDVFIIAFLTAVGAMALPSVPSSSMVTLVIILAALNIPSTTIALLFAVEWFLDRVRSGCNVISHCYCAAIAFRFCQGSLKGLPDTDHTRLDTDGVHKTNGETYAISNSVDSLTVSTRLIPEKTYRAPGLCGPQLSDLRALNQEMRFSCSEEQLQQMMESMEKLTTSFQRVSEMKDPSIPLVKYPRSPGYKPDPEDNPHNAWAWRCDVQGAATGRLAGRTVAIKDSVPVAGVPMRNGSKLLEGYVPEFDATVVTRILDAGGRITGKSAVEDMCCSGSSTTSSDGPVTNPHDTTRSAGGSSSGSAVLVQTGQVDMAIGGDQGGSIRIPASYTGIVGLKPTFGLVPYTGGIGQDPTVDHLGPMTKTVTDCALLLEV